MIGYIVGILVGWFICMFSMIDHTYPINKDQWECQMVNTQTNECTEYSKVKPQQERRVR